MSEEVHIVGQYKYANQSTVHPFGLLAVTILGIYVLVLPRRLSILPFLVIACFISAAQRIVIAGCYFDFLRIMVLLGIIRVVFRKEYLNFTWGALDTLMMLLALSSMIF